MLVRKYPNVAAVYPMTIEKLLTGGLFTPGQFEIVTVYARAIELHPETMSALANVASRALIVAQDPDGLSAFDSRSKQCLVV